MSLCTAWHCCFFWLLFPSFLSHHVITVTDRLSDHYLYHFHCPLNYSDVILHYLNSQAMLSTPSHTFLRAVLYNAYVTLPCDHHNQTKLHTTRRFSHERWEKQAIAIQWMLGHSLSAIKEIQEEPSVRQEFPFKTCPTNQSLMYISKCNCACWCVSCRIFPHRWLFYNIVYEFHKFRCVCQQKCSLLFPLIFYFSEYNPEY